MSRDDHPRVESPGVTDESLREYGRQLAMDALLQTALKTPHLEHKPHSQSHRRRWIAYVALAASVLLAIGITMILRNRDPEVVDVPPAPQLAAGWRIVPTGSASYRVLAADRVQLDAGEIFVESVATSTGGNRPVLLVSTPEGTANASGTQFFIGTYPLQSDLLKGTSMRQLTRVLVLSGAVMLSNLHGDVTGHANELLAAESGKPPVNHAVKANTDFALDLYKQLAKENEGKNLFFSPYSLSTALAMTAEGARGDTANQMGKVLRFPEAARQIGDRNDLLPWSTTIIHTGMKDLHERFNRRDATPEQQARLADLRKQHAAYRAKADKQGGFLTEEKEIEAEERLEKQISELSAQNEPYELRTANALWGEQTYPLSQSYLDTVGKFYGTGAVNAVDFKNDHETVRKRINGWVERQTKDRIRDILPSGALTADTALVLTNAIYFKGAWTEPFEKDLTSEEDFQTAGGAVQTEMMLHPFLSVGRYAAFNADGTYYATPRLVKSNDDKIYAPASGGVLIAEVPYKGGDLAMVLLVPVDARGLGALEAGLNSKRLETWLSRLEARSMQLRMPRFKVSAAYKLKQSLESLGMTRAFVNPMRSTEGAQFDGISNTDDPTRKLFITQVFHNGFIEVTETGTEAAAATVVRGGAGGVPTAVPYMPAVRADRPFLYLIRDVKTGTVLFLGRVSDPTK